MSSDVLRRQRQAADPNASVWVAANAGAGKTRVLTDRVLRLMLAGTPPERILCLTFTKAAAAEMATRLFDGLADWARADEATLKGHLSHLLGAPPAFDLALARRLFARALETPGGLRVQTIHAFCESLLGRFPIEAGVAPHFQVMDERQAAEVQRAARDAALTAGADDPERNRALAAVIAHADERRLDKLIQELNAKRRALAEMFAAWHGATGVAGALRAAMDLGSEETEQTVMTAAASALTPGEEDALHQAVAALAESTAQDGARAYRIATWLAKDAAGRARDIDDYQLAFLTAKSEPRKRLATKPLLKVRPEIADVLGREQERLLAVVERRRAARVAEASTGLFRLGQDMLAAYVHEKARLGVLDYEDLILRARDLLATADMAPWVLYKLDGGLDHILIDEAQDTSPAQWQVIQALAVEFFAGLGARQTVRTVFAVGDPKQSIFSFQGADPAAFAAMRTHFAGGVAQAGAEWQNEELLRSFRSTPAILRAVDRVFADEEARQAVDGEGRLVEHQAHRDDQPGLVELWPPEKPDSDADPDPWDAPLDYLSESDPKVRLAQRIAGRIKSWINGGETVSGRDGRARPIGAGDILILVRRRDPFASVMVRELKRLNIQVSGVDRMVLTEQIAVMDLLALGRAVLLPDDDLTFATVLKSPLFGLTEDHLFELAHGRDGGLWQALRDRRGERPEFEAAAKRFEALRAAADTAPPFDFFARLLGPDGGRRQLTARLGPDANDPLDELLGLALAYERDHVPSLQGFLAWVASGQAVIKRDLEQGGGAVRVMTVHGAKGLEAPVVILPDTAKVPDGRHDSGLMAAAPEPGGGNAAPPLMLWSPRAGDDPGLAAAAREAVRRAEQAEFLRLLYVAMTRARDRLYVAAWEDKKKSVAEGSWYQRIERALHDLGAAEIVAPEACLRLGEVPPPSPSESTAETGFGAPAWLDRPAPAEPQAGRPLSPSRLGEDEPAVVRPLADDGARFRRGNWIHGLLERLPDVAPAARRQAALTWLAAPGRDVQGDGAQALADEVLAVLDEPQFAALFGPGSRAEVAIAGRVGGVEISGRIDRLVVAYAAVAIVDYKSNRPPPETPDAVAPIYLRQMAAYRALLRPIFPDRPIRACLLWTDGPRLMALPDDLLDQAVGALTAAASP